MGTFKQKLFECSRTPEDEKHNALIEGQIELVQKDLDVILHRLYKANQLKRDRGGSLLVNEYRLYKQLEEKKNNLVAEIETLRAQLT